jgi:hypothetical protein
MPASEARDHAPGLYRVDPSTDKYVGFFLETASQKMAVGPGPSTCASRGDLQAAPMERGQEFCWRNELEPSARRLFSFWAPPDRRLFHCCRIDLSLCLSTPLPDPGFTGVAARWDSIESSIPLPTSTSASPLAKSLPPPDSSGPGRVCRTSKKVRGVRPVVVKRPPVKVVEIRGAYLGHRCRPSAGSARIT